MILQMTFNNFRFKFSNSAERGFQVVSVNILFVFILFTSSFGNPSINYEVEPREVTIGDPIELFLNIKFDSEKKLVLPAPESFTPAEIISIDTLSLTKNEYSVRYVFSLFEPGDTDLPDIPVLLLDDEKVDTFWIDPGYINVVSVLNPEDSLSNIRDIHPPVKLSWTLKEILAYLLPVVGLAILAFAIYYIWRRFKKSRGELPVRVIPLPPPFETALRKMEKLRIKKLWQNGYILEYYSELTEILKQYIGGRYGINAPEMTTYELTIAKSKWTNDDHEYFLMQKILNNADLVKFAKFQPKREDHESSMDSGFEFLKRTKPAQVSTQETDIIESEKMNAETNLVSGG